ncbi:IQ motif and ankyrin repeat domain-containing protein 1-like [Haliotis rubra]|uniref:IQ motif and ankyrin repeat domain-containing protein 1-like n=1 Tax=Haliotis rubra TaxID=36100 RepID=UPI001EE61FE3|nr:IQ motif and ankyrin repeat domain-containing protein 1-like [Haliotis rubra]
MPPKKTFQTKPSATTTAKTKGDKGITTKKVAAGPGKKPVTSTGKGKTGRKTEQAKPKEKVWTREDDAARTIQTSYRRFQAKLFLEKKKKEKKEYDELIDKLEKEAFVKLVKKQQEDAEKERKIEEEERRKKAEQRKRIKRVLEAAFDGDNDELLAVFREVSELDDKAGVGHDDIGRAIRKKHLLSLVECVDANDNSALSEAANGGCADTLHLLLEHGANPNTQGQFGRTPLYRAAFAGHLEACQVLMQHGADPRIFAADGQTSEQVASVEAVCQFLAQWDIGQTEVLLQKLEADKERWLEEERRGLEAVQNKLEEQVKIAQKEFVSKQKQLNQAYCELEKRITEHDTAAASGFERTDITLNTVHDAELELEVIKIDFEKAQDKLAFAKMKLREQQMTLPGVTGGHADLPGVKVMVRELDEILLRDVGNKIKDSGKWPLIIDTSGQAAVFLRYRDTNNMNALRPADMEPDRIRMALLGAIRFGKPVVLDMMEVDMFETFSDRMDLIQKGLMASVMNKTILQNHRYFSLLKDSDGEEYSRTRFNDLYTQNFRFFIVTKNPYPPESLMEMTYPIRVFIPT